MYSFRCRSCGHLVPSGHAGERKTPRACPVCRAGVTWTNGTATDRPDNWEVLADASPARLAELGLAAADVEKHTPTTKEANVKAGLDTIKEHRAFLKAKRDHWAANREKIAEEFRQLNAQYDDLGQQLDAVDSDPSELARLTDEREAVYQKMLALAKLEPTGRDDAHEAHLAEWQKKHEAYLAGQGGAAQPRALVVGARDGAYTRDHS